MTDQATPRRSSGLRWQLFGMPVSVPLSGMIGVAVIAWLWAPTFGSGPAAILAAVVFALLLYAGILAHELAHGLSARKLGHKVHGITLWIFGGYTVYERDGTTPGKEATIAASGPIVTLALAAGFYFLAQILQGAAPEEVVRVAAALAWTNLLLGVINLLPGLPLDGGGVVSAAVWAISGRESTGLKAAAWAGRVLAILVAATPLVLAALPGSNVDLITVMVLAIFGVFLWTGATASLRRAQLEQRLPQLSAFSLARRAVPASPRDSLAIAQQRMSDAGAGAIVVQSDDGTPLGIVNESAANATPPERRPWVPVSSLATTLPMDHSIDSSLEGRDLITALQRLRLPAVLVRDSSGAIYGVLFIDDVEQALN